MSIRTVVSCDVCGVEKLQTNHWYMGSTFPDMNPPRLLIYPLSMQDVTNYTRIMCGEECVHKYIAQNLAELHKV